MRIHNERKKPIYTPICTHHIRSWFLYSHMYPVIVRRVTKEWHHFFVSKMFLMRLPSRNVQHELQRWPLKNIKHSRKETTGKRGEKKGITRYMIVGIPAKKKTAPDLTRSKKSYLYNTVERQKKYFIHSNQFKPLITLHLRGTRYVSETALAQHLLTVNAIPGIYSCRWSTTVVGRDLSRVRKISREIVTVMLIV